MFFFFKQKTAYEMRISDWSSDVCSSDLTIGVGGLADHASSMGLEEKPEDFGQTLATWGVNAGPYVMLPLLGPSTLRDAVGFGVEVAGDPVGLAVKEYSGLSSTQRLALPAMEALDLRAQLNIGRASGWERGC